MITVYHRVHLDFMDDVTVISAAWPDDFVRVAEVATDDLETAWRLTNTIDRYWGDNPGVTEHGKTHTREQVQLGR